MSSGTAEEAFREGRLDVALADLQARVRSQPADARLRIFLAQLLMVEGAWDRAHDQLGVAAELDAEALPMMHAYRAAIRCERLRQSVFRGERSPLLLGEPEPWMALYLQALTLNGGGHAEQAAEIRAQAAEQAPATAGTANGQPFEWIADGDSRIGPFFEVLLNGAYYWAPVHRVRSIVIEAPADARDLVWLPAIFVWANGGEAHGLLPARYPGSESSDDPSIRLSRKTEWTDLGADTYAGLGQKMLVTDAAEFPLLDLRKVELAA